MAIITSKYGQGSTVRPGPVRFATDTEAANGTNVFAAIKPDQLAAAVGAGIGSIVGGLTYKGLFDAGIGVPDLVANDAKAGWFYKVSNAGTLFGQDWQVGDHLIVNTDIDGNLTNDKIDKIDNTESISVLDDLTDVTITSAENRQALVFNNGEWVNGDIIYNVPDLEDVFLEERITSVSYTSSYASSSLTDHRDHVIDCRQLTPVNGKKVVTLPGTLVEGESLVYVTNIGGGEIQLRVSGSTSFGIGDSTPRDYGSNIRIKAVGTIQQQTIGGVTTDYMVWSLSTEAIGERQVLGSTNDLVSWGNHFLNVAHVAGAARQGEIDTVEASVGLATDGTFIEHTGTNWLNGTTTFRGADIALDTALKAEQTSRISTDNSLQNQITANLNEINQIEASVGLEGDGTLSAWSTTGNTISSTSTVKEAIEALDGEVAEVRQLTVSGVDDLQAELDQTQLSAGLEVDGTYVPDSNATYIPLATSLKDADSKLDAALKAEEDARISEIARVDGVNATQDARLTALEGVDPQHQNEIDLIEAAVGLDSDGNLPAWSTTGTTIGATTTIKSAVEALDGEIEDIRQLTVGGIDDLQSELDATQTGAGLETDGTYLANGSSNYISAATSLKDADTKLDTAIKTKHDESIAYTDAEILTLSNTVSDLQAELDATQAGAGLEADGSWVVNPGAFFQNNTNYGVIDSMHTAVDALDYEIYTIYEHYIDIFKNNWIAPSNGLITISDDSEFDATNFDLSANNTWRFVKGSYTVSSTDPNVPLVIQDPNVTFYTMGSGTGASSVSEFKFPLTITGNDSIRNVFNGFQIEGLTTVNGTLGKHRFINCQLLGGLTLTGMQDFIVFKDCDITGDVLIDATFAGVAYFINCDFDGITSFTNNALATQVIVTECKLFPLAAASSVTPLATMSFDDQSVRFIGTHISLPSAPAFTGNVSELNDDVGYITGNQAPVQSVNTLEGDVVLTGDNVNATITATNYTAADNKIDSHLSGIDDAFGNLGTAADRNVGTAVGNVIEVVDVDGQGTAGYPAIDGSLITGVARELNDLNDVDVNGVANQSVIVYDSNTAQWDDVVLANVAISNSYNSLDNLPTLGTAAAKDYGTASGELVELVDIAGTAGFPILDGSNLINLDLGSNSIDDLSDVTLTTPSDNDTLVWSTDKFVNTPISAVGLSGEYVDLNGTPTTVIGGSTFITDANPLTLEGGIHYIMGTALGSTKVLTLPDASTNGDYIRVTNWGNGDLQIQVNPADPNAYMLSGQDIVLNGSVTVESKATVDLYGFNYSQGGIDYQPAWGIYFQSSIETNTKSLTTDGQILVYDATKKELYAGDLGDMSLSYSATNYDETLGGTVTGTKVVEHFEAIDVALGDKLTASDGLNGLGDVDLATTAPSDNDILVYDSATQKWLPEAITIPTVDPASETTAGIIEIATNAEATAGTATNLALVPSNISSITTAQLDNSAGTLLEASNNLNDLANNATARSNLGLGTVATYNVGTAIGDAIKLEDVGGNAGLPAVDGSQLTGVLPGINNLTSATPGAAYTVTTSTGAMETFILTPTEACSVTLPAPATVGVGYMYNFKNLSTFEVILKGTIDGQTDFSISNQYGAVTIVSDGSSWYIL